MIFYIKVANTQRKNCFVYFCLNKALVREIGCHKVYKIHENHVNGAELRIINKIIEYYTVG